MILSPILQQKGVAYTKIFTVVSFDAAITDYCHVNPGNAFYDFM